MKSEKTDKNIDLFLSIVSVKEILNVNEMIAVRGGDGDTTVPTLPPVLPIP